jgi:hypothetical protein
MVAVDQEHVLIRIVVGQQLINHQYLKIALPTQTQIPIQAIKIQNLFQQHLFLQANNLI